MITARIITDPPKNTLTGGISFKNSHTQRGAHSVSDSIKIPTVTALVVLDPMVMQIKPKANWGTPNKNPIRRSFELKLNVSESKKP